MGLSSQGEKLSFLSLPFMRDALWVSLLVGNAISILGLFVVMRRVSFSGLAISQLAALGAVVGILFTHTSYFTAAFILIFGGLIFLSRIEKKFLIPQEVWIGTLYIIGAATAVLILSKAPLGESHTLTIFFGNILALGAKEIWEALFLLIVTWTVIGLWFFKWVWISFDAQAFETAGLSLKKWDIVFYGLLAMNMMLSIHLVGVLLAFSYLILPITLGLLTMNRLKSLVVFIPISTAIITFFSFDISFRYDLPTSPTIAAALAGLVILTAVYKRIRS